LNIYVVVEGKRTEPKLFRAWLPELLPGATEIQSFDQARDKQFYLVAGHGYPSINRRIIAAINDIRDNPGLFDYLVIALDAEDRLVSDVRLGVLEVVEDTGGCPVQVEIIVANCCVESWFLGNQKMMAVSPESPKLQDFQRWYDVRHQDPELMPEHPKARNRADTHIMYLKAMLAERSLKYSKNNPGPVLGSKYLEALGARSDPNAMNPPQLATFHDLWTLVKSLGWK
jgi:hypothetical protein